MKKFISLYSLIIFVFVISFGLFMYSCDSNTLKNTDYAGIVNIVTYQIPGDKPHQYIKFSSGGGAHYPECKYCKENNDSIN